MIAQAHSLMYLDGGGFSGRTFGTRRQRITPLCLTPVFQAEGNGSEQFERKLEQ